MASYFYFISGVIVLMFSYKVPPFNRKEFDFAIELHRYSKWMKFGSIYLIIYSIFSFI